MSELPKGWVETTLGNLFEITSSKRVHQHEWTDTGVPFYRAREVKKLSREGYVENELFISEELFLKYAAEFGAPVAGDLMVTAVGTLGECYLVRQADRFYFKDASVLWFRGEGKADSEFIARMFATREVRAQVHKGGGTTVGTYTVSSAKETVVPLPPLAEQNRIVAKLDALNAKSARARTELARIETLVARYKQAVLSKAFSGELSASQRSAPMSRLEVREMLSEIAQGWSPKCEKVSASADQQWAVITTTAIQSFSFQPNENKVLPADLSPRPHLVIEEGDVLITRAGPRVRCGICCYVERSRPKLMLCDKAYRLRLKKLFDPKLFVFLMNSPELLSKIEDMKTGGNDSGLNLTQERFMGLVVPVWPLPEQHEIVRRIEAAFARIDRLATEAKRALELVGKLDEAILAKAFRGELVPQDENDEPAEHLLARIRAEREAAPKGKRGRGAKG